MTPERELQIDELFHSALELGPVDRQELLERSCPDDSELIHEVQSLLEAYEGSTKIFAGAAADIAASLLANGHFDPRIGQQINQYKVHSLLGRGGMGGVYSATDERLGRQIAIKILPAIFSEEMVHRFEIEARAISALNHPNILTIHEIGQTETSPFIVTELIEGATLRETLTRERIERGRAIEIALQILSALNAAHSAGIIHRDIKPENIMLRNDGYVKVLDFGIVKLTRDFDGQRSQGLTGSEQGLILGTLRYMSPEQALGTEVDARTDIWSFGVVLYEMITGTTPFRGDSRDDVVSLILNNEPPPLSELSIETPVELQSIVTRCLAKNRDDRYQTTRELQDDLSRLKQRLDFEIANKLPEAKIPFETIFLNSSGEERKKITAFLADLSSFTTLTENLGAALMMKAQLSESIEIYQTMLETAEAKGDNLALARAYNGLALVQDRRSETKAMLESATKAEYFATQAGGSEEAISELITALVRQGYAHYRSGNAADMISRSERILELANEGGENGKRQQARGLTLFGTAYRILGEFDQAESYCRRALSLYRELGDKRSISNSLNFSGEIARLRGDHEAAILQYQEALDISREIGEKMQQLTLLGNIGGALVGLEDFAGAEKILLEVIELSGAAGYYGLSENYAFLAAALLGQDKNEEALRYGQKALMLARETNNQEHLGGAWRIVGMVLVRLSRDISIDDEEMGARSCFAESLAIFSDAKMAAERAHTLREWSYYERRSNNDDEAKRMWQESHEIFTHLVMPLELARMTASHN